MIYEEFANTPEMQEFLWAIRRLMSHNWIYGAYAIYKDDFEYAPGHLFFTARVRPQCIAKWKKYTKEGFTWALIETLHRMGYQASIIPIETTHPWEWKGKVELNKEGVLKSEQNNSGNSTDSCGMVGR